MCYNSPMAYSVDFREKVLAYCERESISKAAEVFQINRSTIYGWRQLKAQTGSLKHQVKGTKPTKIDRKKLEKLISENPDSYLYELAEEFDCYPSAIHYALKSLGYSRKKRIAPIKSKTQKK